MNLELDFRSGIPIYLQVVERIKERLAAGKLKPGDQLPTVRSLALELRVNFNTVARAYKELEIRGILNTQQGTGTFIGEQSVAVDDIERRRLINRLLDEFLARAAQQGLTLAEIREALAEREVK